MDFQFTKNNDEVEYKCVEISRQEWEHDNEYEISDLWNSLLNYLKHTNVHMLDKCNYTTFSEFVSLNTTPLPKYEESEETCDLD